MEVASWRRRSLMKKVSLVLLAIMCFALGYIVSSGTAVLGAAEEQPAVSPGGPDYLYIMDFEIGHNMVINDGIAEASEWVRQLRNTGQFKTVRLYMHHTGSKAAVYILAEPKSWQSIETGFEQWMDAIAVMTTPWRWASHSDDLLSEIPVK